MLTPSKVSLSFCILALTGTLAFAQKPNTNPEKAPDFSDADKKKMADIEQRPEIKEQIQAAWDEKRRADIDYAYNINSSAHFSDLSGPEFATFRDHYGQLYNNPMLQRYINAIGQRLVPKDSPNIYSFKLLLDPIPKAEALSTGTILVSTGMVSMLDNEAQLAYVLGHEIAHVEKNHAYTIVRMSVLEPALNAEKEKETKEKRAVLGAVTTFATGGLGGIYGGFNGAVGGALAGLAGGIVSGNLIFRDHNTVTQWADLYENEADEQSLHYMLAQGYDVREAPRLYARLQTAASRDPRIGLGFMAKESRMKSRTAHIQTVLSGDFKTAFEAKLKAGGLTGSSGEFALIMSALKRDNGIIAIDYDLFAMARDNLEDAVDLRSNDPRAQLYLGKVISLTARTPDDRQKAEEHFMKAIQYDGTRGAYPDPHLEHALHLIGENGDKAEINNEIQAYVALYQREHMGSLPTNMAILYDYLTLVGDTNWYAAPAAVVSTKNVEAIRINSSGNPGPLTGPQVISSVLSPGTSTSPQPVEVSATNSGTGQDTRWQKDRRAMRLTAFAVGLAFISVAALGSAQRVAIGIAPAYDAGGDDYGEAVVQHLTLFAYRDLVGSKQFVPVLLNPGGVYTPLDTSWLTEYVQDRPNLDTLLVTTLKPSVSADKGTTLTINVELSLLDAHTGESKSTWTVSDTIKAKNAWFEKGTAMVTSAINDRSDKYGFGISSTSDFEKQPIGKSTLHLAELIRDSLPAHLGSLAKNVSDKPADAPPAASAPCATHTKITYNYKHSVSHSYTLLANGLDQTLTIQDGVSTFQAPEGPLLLQFTINDAPYKLSREPVYQLSTIHSCKNSTLVIDIGQGGDAHDHWE